MRTTASLLAALLVGCTSQADDDFWRAEPPCYIDADGDGYGSPRATTASGGDCGDAAGEVLLGADCDDTSAAIHPGATEIPDDWIDGNCDGLESVSCMPDRDGDGYGAPPLQIEEDGDCDEANLRPAWDFVDCDDSDADVNIGSPEIPEDGIDQDCDGVDAPRCYYDGDRDGFGAGDG
jgi:hypothetical protein